MGYYHVDLCIWLWQELVQQPHQSKEQFLCFFFGLGTAPMMFSLSILPKFLSNKKRLFINRYLPFYTFVLATFFILRGLNLGIPYLSPQFEKQEVSQTIPVCHSLIKN
jgi:sulfite exporter TauE/SafE